MTFIESDELSQDKAPDPERGLFSKPDPSVAEEFRMVVPQLERRSGYTTMTRMERDTYDAASPHRRNEWLFLPGTISPEKLEKRLSGHIRPGATAVLVDGADIAEIPLEDFRKVDPRLFAEMSRYARQRHSLDRPGLLIELTEQLIQKNS